MAENDNLAARLSGFRLVWLLTIMIDRLVPAMALRTTSNWMSNTEFNANNEHQPAPPEPKMVREKTWLGFCFAPAKPLWPETPLPTLSKPKQVGAESSGRTAATRRGRKDKTALLPPGTSHAAAS